MKIQSTALKTRKTVEMDHVRRRLSSSSNNVSNMRLDGAMGIPLQVQVSMGWAEFGSESCMEIFAAFKKYRYRIPVLLPNELEN
jgi:hypothetical protein